MEFVNSTRSGFLTIMLVSSALKWPWFLGDHLCTVWKTEDQRWNIHVYIHIKVLTVVQILSFFGLQQTWTLHERVPYSVGNVTLLKINLGSPIFKSSVGEPTACLLSPYGVAISLGAHWCWILLCGFPHTRNIKLGSTVLIL
jgi:hypothetical protein